MNSPISDRESLARLFLTLILVTLGGCPFTEPTPELDLIYTESAKYQSPDRNPIIPIPGMLGSRLLDRPSGQVV